MNYTGPQQIAACLDKMVGVLAMLDVFRLQDSAKRAAHNFIIRFSQNMKSFSQEITTTSDFSESKVCKVISNRSLNKKKQQQ